MKRSQTQKVRARRPRQPGQRVEPAAEAALAAPDADHAAPAGGRREFLLDRAGELIAAKGYDGTSMRDIATAVGMLPGSLYYHFPSKEALFLMLHRRVVARMEAGVRAALSRHEDPWDRLEAAAVAHLEGLLATGNLVAIVSPDFLDGRTGIGDEIRAERSRYEQIFRDLFAALDLPEGFDPGLQRLLLLGALNWTPTWFEPARAGRPGGADARRIATQAVAVLRGAVAAARRTRRAESRG